MTIGTGRVRLLAEIGTSHSGDRVLAAELVDAAAETGADCVKTQIVFADEIIHPAAGNVPLPGGDADLYGRFRQLERDPDFYAAMKDRATARGLEFLCSVFGPRSLELYRSLEPGRIKIASPELNHLPLLALVAATGLPVILSTGVSTLADIETALSITGKESVLLHCVTAYPAPETEYNLSLIGLYSRLFGVECGVSDHSLDPLLVPLVSILCGGTMIEKHLTLDRKGGGLDDPVALIPADFRRMRDACDRASAMSPMDLQAWLDDNYGKETIAAVAGTGEKRLAPAEAANYGRTNRSIHALRDLVPGDILYKGSIAVLRTEKVLEPGLHPRYWNLVLGKKLVRPVPAGQGLTWAHIIPGAT